MNFDTNKTPNKKFVIVIAGPTASGKTSLSLALAKKYNAEIFSADSRQIYREMNIGTAKPSARELSDIPHHFINHRSIQNHFTAGIYQRELTEKLKHYFETHNIAVLVGGTGLYIKSFLEGLDDLPAVKAETLEYLNTQYEVMGLPYLQELLKEYDPTYYKTVDLANPRRLIRALSVCLSQDFPYSSFLGSQPNTSAPDFETIGIILAPPRDILYTNINRRVDDMIANGLEEEVRALIPFKDKTALKTVGYSEFFDYFENINTLEKTIELIKQNSRRYAKRQNTWFKKFGTGKTFSEWNDPSIFEYTENSLLL
ncbi:MAG: tRNA (adenosine(37)-N6)-dimethylallyltransferase MiaA [Saprospiraceae bacterium]|nr:tRNA (adenosine(37)-N6)-dimethylallyltransferase MiaA [Saprospiraceae bacterium]